MGGLTRDPDANQTGCQIRASLFGEENKFRNAGEYFGKDRHWGYLRSPSDREPQGRTPKARGKAVEALGKQMDSN